jgi:hypothetical protein
VLEWTDELHRKVLKLFNFGFPVSSSVTDIAGGVDEGALTTILVKRILQNLIGLGTNAAAKNFQNESKVFADMKALPQFTFGMLHRRFLTNGSAADADAKLAQVMQLRSGSVMDALLFCYPRVICVDDGSLKLTSKASFGDGLMVVHMIDTIYIWAPTEEMLAEEIANAVSPQGVIDMDMLAGPRADALRAIVAAEWELSLCYLIVMPLAGREAVEGFCVEETQGDVPTFANWSQQGKFMKVEAAAAS